MSESIEKTQQLLLEAQKKTDEARKALEATEEQVRVIDDIHLNVDVTFPKTTEALEGIESNIGRVSEYRRSLEKTISSIEAVRKGVDQINALEKGFEAYLKEIYFLDKHQRYPIAFKRLNELEALCGSVDFGEQLNVQKTLLEIVAWTRCCLYDHLGDFNIRAGFAPLTPEELATFEELVEALPTNIHKPEQLDVFRDKIRGFRCVMRAKDSLANGRSLESLNSSLALLMEVGEHRDTFSRFTGERYNYLYSVAIDEYNYLTVDAFDARRNYEDSEALFNLRGYFTPESILHADFRDATDAHDFKIRFLKAEALRMDDEAFSIAVCAYADSIRSQDEFEMEVLSQYLAMPDLPEEKVTLLLTAVNRLSFELMIQLLGQTLPLGLEVSRQSAILDGIYQKKEKVLNLENSAKSLQNCLSLLDESLQKRFINFEKELLRSPHAHKVCVKSANPDIHALYGEPSDAMRRPLGKPLSNPNVKPWDYALKTLFFAFGLALPLILCAALFGVLYLLFREEKFGTYLMAAPFVLALFVLHIFMCVRFGRDERGSAVFRRALGIDALLKAGLSLAYFILPETLSMFAPVGIGIFIAAAVEGLWGFFLYKDIKKVATVFIYVPVLLCEIAGVVFMILGMMNGKIG